MPRDIENMPFARSAPFQEPAPADAGSRDAALRLESMLLEEFNYASVTAYQANEDRARMFNLYLLLIGVLGSGLAAAYQLGGGLKSYAGELSVALLLVAGCMGIAFFIKLIRLRQAWRESALAMSLIKEYYIAQFSASAPNAARAFYWRLRTLPTGEKRTSTTAVVCGTVALLGSLCFAGAAVVLGLLFLPQWLGATEAVELAWAIAGVVLMVALLLFAWEYSHAFDRVREAAQTLRAAWGADLAVDTIWDGLNRKLKPSECERIVERLRADKDCAQLVAALNEKLSEPTA